MPAATLKIFLAFGDPKRLRTAELSNWIGKAVAGPRSEFEKVLEREESQNPGVYFLTGMDPDTNKSAIYIGEAECIRDRIKSHLAKDFWNNITFFVTKDENLTKAHIRYIEGRLIEVSKNGDPVIEFSNIAFEDYNGHVQNGAWLAPEYFEQLPVCSRHAEPRR